MFDLPTSAALVGMAVAFVGLGAFVGLVVGFRVGQRDGRREAELNRQAHWVDLLERSAAQARSRDAHPSRSGSDTGRLAR
jgi:hypothetical protein